MEKIKAKPLDDKLTLIDDSIIYLNDRIANFDITKFRIDILENVNFVVKVAHSYDNQNWSTPIDLLTLTDISDYNDLLQIDINTSFVPDVYFSIWLTKFETPASEDTMYIEKNLEDTIQKIVIESIKYNNIDVECKSSTFKTLINQYPKWNLYDNQYVTVKAWIEQCVSLSKSFGHICIYFKTEADSVNHTLSTTDTRQVIAVKKIFVQFPDNELPEDKNVYSDWDYAMEGDSVMHIVDKNFKFAFGEDTVPLQKDYFYLPILNKLFKISSVQPGKPFMGVIGFWETYISKYEEDETITMSEEIMSAMSGFGDFDAIEEMLEEMDNFKTVNTLSTEEILEKTIDEKKAVTENFTNRLNDSTRFIDLKETELQREFFDKRLEIVSINPDNNAFPVTMYDCSTVTKNTVGLTYNLKDNVSVNKKSLILQSDLSITFNYILSGKYSGVIFDLLDVNDNSILSIESKRNKIQVINHVSDKTILVDYEILPMEYYQININYNNELDQIAVSIFILKNTQKKLEFQQVYINNPSTNKPTLEFKNIYLYGGNYYIGEVYFHLNGNKILSDYVNPILNMNKFGK